LSALCPGRAKPHAVRPNHTCSAHSGYLSSASQRHSSQRPRHLTPLERGVVLHPCLISKIRPKAGMRDRCTAPRPRRLVVPRRPDIHAVTIVRIAESPLVYFDYLSSTLNHLTKTSSIRSVSQNPTKASDPRYHVHGAITVPIPNEPWNFPQTVPLRHCRLLRATVA
jgi:hypothetical protein